MQPMKKQNEKILNYAKDLRQNMTDFEQLLWQNLRAKRFMGFKFKRQVPIDNYIVDFLCTDNKLIIELDGSQHFENINYDRERDEYLANKGYKVVRITNDNINNLEGVLEYIRKLIT